MSRVADVVIAGGGVIGASIAWHLAVRGVRDVVVLDRGMPGNGSTSKATGGFRSQFATAINIRLSLMSRAKLRHFEEEVGCDSGYRPRGYLFLAGTEEELAILSAANRLQREEGVAEARVVSHAEAREIQPFADPASFCGGTYSPTDGFVQPMAILRGYRDDAIRRGVTFMDNAPLLRSSRRGSRIESVDTPAGTFAAHRFVNAAGAWAGVLGREQFGCEVPVTPLRRCVVPTHPTEVLPESMPMTIWVGDGFHLRVRDGRVLLLWPDQPTTRDPFDMTVDDAWIDRVERFAYQRLPALAHLPLDRAAAWSGLYEMSPDRHAILGGAAEIDNLVLANGSSGHGVMHAPASGQLIAEEIIDGRAHSIDLHALRPTRFAEGEPVAGPALL